MQCFVHGPLAHLLNVNDERASWDNRIPVRVTQRSCRHGPQATNTCCMLLVAASSMLYTPSTENCVNKRSSSETGATITHHRTHLSVAHSAAPLHSSPMFTIDIHPPNLIVQIGEAKTQSHEGGARRFPLAQLSPSANRLLFVAPRNASRVQTFKWRLHIWRFGFLASTVMSPV